MDEKKIIAAILDLEEVVNKAEELHAITLLQYDSFVEGSRFASNSQVYKTTTNIIEREAGEVHEMLQEKFNQLYGLVKAEKPTEIVQEGGKADERTTVIHSAGGSQNTPVQS